MIPPVDNLEEFIVIDKRIDTAEDQAADSLRESIRDRWEFGRLILAKRKGKQLPKGVLDELAGATGKSRAELQFRAQFAERYPTEDEVSRAIGTFTPWTQVKRGLPKPPEPSKGKPKPQPSAPTPPVTPVTDKPPATDVTAINWELQSLKVKEREAVMRRAIRRELEAEFEPRVQAEVQARVGAARKRIQQDEAQAKRITDAHNGVFDRADYAVIRSCLHPDSRDAVSVEKLARAFRLVTEARTLLEKKKEPPAKASTLPPYDDLQKRRRTPRR